MRELGDERRLWETAPPGAPRCGQLEPGVFPMPVDLAMVERSRVWLGERRPIEKEPGEERREPDAGLLRRAGFRTCLGLACVLFMAGLGLLAAAPAHAQGEGDLRLAGGASLSHHEGRLEIYHSGAWGTVCDDYFQLQEAEVACKQMGFTGADELVRGWRGPSSRSIWLDDVDCDGTETSLSQCSSRGWGVHNCAHSEDVGMRCTAATTAAGVLIGKRKLRIRTCNRMDFDRSSNDRSSSCAHEQLRYQPPTRCSRAIPPPRIGLLAPMITGPETDRPHPAVRLQQDAQRGSSVVSAPPQIPPHAVRRRYWVSRPMHWRDPA